MKTTIILLFTLSTFISCEQNITCEDFIEGEFISTSSAFPGVEWKTIKTKNSQIDFETKIPEKYIGRGISTDTTFANINQIDNCTYFYFYDETNTDFPEFLKILNESGFLIEKKKIVDNCLYWIMTHEGQCIVEGTICKTN
ncbi:hypothetical protein WNY78_18035 [Psychroserpens sp. AS72]|uniref:hypothetical protein n=1 Tax=Psychroserpens sp. AS72 TaxID=3135775 RepID=UPI0031706B5C